MRSSFLFWLAAAALLAPLSALQPHLGAAPHQAAPLRRMAPLRMAKTKAKAKAKGGKKAGPAAKPRGFGKPPPKPGEVGVLLEDPAYAELNEQLTAAGANLKRVAIADFGGLRGVMALEDLAKGDEIVSIPGPCAVNLGSQSVDPVAAAVALLEASERDAASGRRQAYWGLLPSLEAADLCTPDYFTEAEMAMLQWPPVEEEVRLRKEAMDEALAAAPQLMADASAEERRRKLRWATFLVLSRVLTVQGPAGPMGGASKLLIPFLDMFNHRADCKHYLTGRTDGAPPPCP